VLKGSFWGGSTTEGPWKKRKMGSFAEWLLGGVFQRGETKKGGNLKITNNCTDQESKLTIRNQMTQDKLRGEKRKFRKKWRQGGGGGEKVKEEERNEKNLGFSLEKRSCDSTKSKNE